MYKIHCRIQAYLKRMLKYVDLTLYIQNMLSHSAN